MSDINAAQSAYLALSQITQSSAGKAGGVILTMFIAIGLVVGTWLDITTCSRLTYALARDNGYIFSTFSIPSTITGKFLFDLYGFQL